MRSALSVFWRSLQYWSDEIALLVQMNAAWVLAMLLIIPGPPATAALLVVANRMAHGELVSWRVARDAFRRYFWKAWGWAALNAAFIGLLIYNYLFYRNQASGTLWIVVQVAWAAVALAWAALQLYWWPLLLEMPDHPLIGSLRNAAKLALLNPLFTGMLTLVSLLFVAIGIGLALPATLMLTSVLALVANHATLDRLAAYRELRAQLEEPLPASATLEGIDRPAPASTARVRPPRPRSRSGRRRSTRRKG